MLCKEPELAGLLTWADTYSKGERARCWFCLDSPNPSCEGEERRVCLGVTRAFFVCFPGIFPCLGSGPRADQV